jgi:hypothetical protein
MVFLQEFIRSSLVAILLATCLNICSTDISIAAAFAKDKNAMVEAEVLAKEIEAILTDAGKMIEKQEWKSANELLKRGLTILGDRFYPSDVIDGSGKDLVIDDSGMELIIADDKESKGDFKIAAQIRYQSLSDRLGRFKLKIGK